MSKTRRMVAGFLFSNDLSLLALVRKNRPDWMAGKLNAIGGHIEEFDADALAAQIREFREAGITVNHWIEVCTLGGADWEVTFFAARSHTLRDVESQTDELIGVYPVSDFLWRSEATGVVTMPNLIWLIPMALQRLANPTQGRYLIAEEPTP